MGENLGLGAIAFVVAFVNAGLAGAAEPSAADRDTSRALYVQGMAALDAHDYLSAERSCGGAHALVKVPTSAACWARALEGLGRLVEARDEFLEATHYPLKPDEPSVFTSARDASRAEAERLSTRIPTVTLVVSGPDEAAPLRVTFDDAIVAPATARLPRKANPGRHAITVVAGGFELTTTDLDLSEGEDRHVSVALSPVSRGETAKISTSGEVPTASTQSVHGVPTVAMIVGGAGAAGLVVGVAAAFAATSKHTTLQSECDGSACPPSAEGDLDSFHTLRAVSAVGYVVGALGLVGGATLWYFAPPEPSGRGARAWVGPTSAGVAGEF